MKRIILSSDLISDIKLDKIVSLVLVGDIDSYNPRDAYVFSSKDIDYSTLTYDQLKQLGKKELAKIHDVRILRKLQKSDLTLQQQREVTQANMDNFKSSRKLVNAALNKLRQCPAVHVWQTTKNNEFAQKIWELGGRLRDEDATNIVHELTIDNYSYSTLSYVDTNWNALLMVFGYNKPYTFKGRDADHKPVTVEAFSVYIKIDIDNETNEGYAAMSFHEPEFRLTYPYASSDQK